MLAYKTCSIFDYSDTTISQFVKEIPLSKREHIFKCKNQKRQRQSIVAEIVLKELLDQHTDIQYEQIEYVYNKNGKPYIKGNPIYFNISHSNEYVSVVISDTEVGIDIQEINENTLKACKLVFTDEVYQFLLEKNDIELSTYVYACKEAFIKQQGLSLKHIQTPIFHIIDGILSPITQEIQFKKIHTFPSYQNVICIVK